jgi:hypothetical protein
MYGWKIYRRCKSWETMKNVEKAALKMLPHFLSTVYVSLVTGLGKWEQSINIENKYINFREMPSDIIVCHRKPFFKKFSNLVLVSSEWILVPGGTGSSETNPYVTGDQLKYLVASDMPASIKEYLKPTF